MKGPLFGVETEYAFSALDADGEALDREVTLALAFQIARRRFPHLLDLRSQAGVFLANGARLYLDCGLHPELATPECTSPAELVRYLLAGERVLEEVAREMPAADPRVAHALFAKCNLDYGGSGTTWGCHESYLTRGTDVASLARQLIPLLVTRILYTGAGGFDPFAPGIEFMLSPRACHLRAVLSPSSTEARGIVHTKQESLSRGSGRLHLICGESLSSQLGSYLKLGVTALVVALADAGLEPGEVVILASPLEALQTVARDEGCQARLPLASGTAATALEIQRHYLDQVRRHRRRLPEWADAVCSAWADVLARIERAGAGGLSTALDWATKRAVYADRARARGIAWESVAAWNQALREGIGRPWQGELPAPSGELRLASDGPNAAVAARLARRVRELGLDWRELPALLALRQELLEIDTRFGALGPEGVFRQLEGAGVLTHQVAGVEPVEPAISQPPPNGRARLRGEWVSRAHASGARYRCDWTGIQDLQAARWLDLSDPWETRESWTSPPPPGV